MRVLVFAYHFPPLGGAGVQRSVKLARYLPEFGVDVSVVTGPATAASQPTDATLAQELPADLRVIRIGGAPGDVLTATRDDGMSFLRRLLRRHSPTERAWIEGCITTGLAASAEFRPDLLYASMSPFETSEAMAWLSRRLGIPWVADLRDPWALDEMFVYPSALHRRLEERRMRSVLKSASLVVMNTPEATRALLTTFPEFSRARVVTIPNGFDSSDFAESAPKRDASRFTIVHTGHLHADLGARHRSRLWLRRILGGQRVEVDIEARSHVYLLRALEKWTSEEPDLRPAVQLILAGPVSDQDREIVRRSSVADWVRMPGYVNHPESIRLLRSADVLFLPMHGLPPGERARIVPGKTYEYLAAGRPILAAVPPGDARDLVDASSVGHTCAPRDVDAMHRILKELHESASHGLSTPATCLDRIGRFDRRRLAHELASELHLLARGPCRRSEGSQPTNSRT